MGLKNIGTNTTNEELLCKKCASRISMGGYPDFAEGFNSYPAPIIPVQYIYTGYPPMLYHYHHHENKPVAAGCPPYFPCHCYSFPHLVPHNHLPHPGWGCIPPNIRVPSFENTTLKDSDVGCDVPIFPENGNGYTRLYHSGSGENSWPLQSKNSIILREKTNSEFKNMTPILPKYYVDEKCQTEATSDDNFSSPVTFTGSSRMSSARPKSRTFSPYTHLHLGTKASNSEDSIPSDENNGESEPTTTMAEQPSANAQNQNNQINSSQENSPCLEKTSCYTPEPDQSEQFYSENLMSFVFNEELFKNNNDENRQQDSRDTSSTKQSELLEFLQTSSFVYEPERAEKIREEKQENVNIIKRPREFLKGILKNRMDAQSSMVSHSTSTKTEVEAVSNDVTPKRMDAEYKPRYKRRVKQQSFYEPRVPDIRETDEINFNDVSCMIDSAPIDFPKLPGANGMPARETFRFSMARRNQTNCTRNMY